MTPAQIEYIRRFLHTMRVRLGYVPARLLDDEGTVLKFGRWDNEKHEAELLEHIADLEECRLTMRMVWKADALLLPETVTVFLVADVGSPEETLADWTIKRGHEDPVDITITLMKFE